MFFIILCHIFQTYDNDLASFFNIGVQVFLVMSGYLYGKKTITNWNKWAGKRIIKLYIPYFIVTFSVVLLLMVIKNETIRWYQIIAHIINLQGIRLIFDWSQLNIPGLSHLWFMTAIMLAYFTTPLLQKLKKQSEFCSFILLVIVLFLYTFIVSKSTVRLLFGLEWFWLYAFGYFFANISSKSQKLYIAIFSICYLYLFTQINQVFEIGLWTKLGRRHHCTLGILLFTLGVTYLKCYINSSKIMPIFKWFDKYSYFIFLTHFVVMIGDFSLAHITDYIAINILLMLVATAVLTYLLVIVNNQITSKIKQQ